MKTKMRMRTTVGMIGKGRKGLLRHVSRDTLQTTMWIFEILIITPSPRPRQHIWTIVHVNGDCSVIEMLL